MTGILFFCFPFVSGKIEKFKIQEIGLVEFNKPELSFEYEGYLEFPKYNAKRLIKKGVTEEILDSNFVLYYNSFVSLDKNNFNIILLGHNVEGVFRILHYLDLGDEVVLVTHEKCYIFEIYNIDVVSQWDVYVLNEIYDDKTLTLITCMGNNKNRLILRAKLKNI